MINRCRIAFFLMLLVLIPAVVSITGCEKTAVENDAPEEPADGARECPFPIYYALNESHSTSWAQRAPDGTLGIVYGGNDSGDDETVAGDLFYVRILPDGSGPEEIVTTDRGVDKSIILYDSGANPHIFYARSDDSHQIVFHVKKDASGTWEKETVIDLEGSGGEYIYEISGDIDGENAMHLLLLVIRSNPCSDDFMDCFQGSHLYHVTNRSGSWEKELIHVYDTFFTYDMHVKTQRRQDIVVDGQGHAHVVFGEQYQPDPTDHESNYGRLHYATNKSSRWVIELALTPEVVTDDAGWYPSIDLDNSGRPVVVSTYMARVPTHSVRYAQLRYSVRLEKNRWTTAVVADRDDGYFGGDGRRYTGALTHVKIDNNNTPHIVFSDIASSHNPQNVLSTGQIRYAVFDGTSWELSTIYRQPSPQAFYEGREMGGQCLVISPDGQRIQVIGQELVSTGENIYTYNLVHFIIK